MTDAKRPAPSAGDARPAPAQMAGIPKGLWHKCPKCRAMLYQKELERNLRVCGSCQYHFPLSTAERIAMLADEGAFAEIDANLLPVNPLGFPDYADKLARGRAKAGQNEAFVYGDAEIAGAPVVLGVANFGFMGGSMGSVVGEKVARALERGAELGRPVVLVCASGGARMQEGILSLMQMPRSTVAIARLRAAGLPYVVVLTDPTTGGVTASYAMLGDVQIAEPGALIGFAGQRVIQDTIREKLPEGFQRAEYLHAHGMVDMVTHRRDLKVTLAQVIDYLMAAKAA